MPSNANCLGIKGLWGRILPRVLARFYLRFLQNQHGLTCIQTFILKCSCVFISFVPSAWLCIVLVQLFFVATTEAGRYFWKKPGNVFMIGPHHKPSQQSPSDWYPIPPSLLIYTSPLTFATFTPTNVMSVKGSSPQGLKMALDQSPQHFSSLVDLNSKRAIKRASSKAKALSSSSSCSSSCSSSSSCCCCCCAASILLLQLCNVITGLICRLLEQ